MSALLYFCVCLFCRDSSCLCKQTVWAFEFSLEFLLSVCPDFCSWYSSPSNMLKQSGSQSSIRKLLNGCDLLGLCKVWAWFKVLTFTVNVESGGCWIKMYVYFINMNCLFKFLCAAVNVFKMDVLLYLTLTLIFLSCNNKFRFIIFLSLQMYSVHKVLTKNIEYTFCANLSHSELYVPCVTTRWCTRTMRSFFTNADGRVGGCTWRKMLTINAQSDKRIAVKWLTRPTDVI